MRAKSPLDQIEFAGDPVQLPTPRFPVGTPVRYSEKQHPSNPAYYAGLAVRQLLRETRAVVDKLRREGFSTGDPGSRLPAFNKDQIRARLEMMRTADSVEVAGHQPSSMHCSHIANQCYLVNGQCHSGVSFTTYLLFRRTDGDGRKLVYLHPHPLVSENCLVEDRKP